MEFPKATPEQDDILIRHYLAIWESYGTPAGDFNEPDEKVCRSVEEGRDTVNRAQLAKTLGVPARIEIESRAVLNSD